MSTWRDTPTLHALFPKMPESLTPIRRPPESCCLLLILKYLQTQRAGLLWPPPSWWSNLEFCARAAAPLCLGGYGWMAHYNPSLITSSSVCAEEAETKKLAGQDWRGCSEHFDVIICSSTVEALLWGTKCLWGLVLTFGLNSRTNRALKHIRHMASQPPSVLARGWNFGFFFFF